MKILTWNVNGLRALCKKGQFDWLINSGADIIGLQETKSEKGQLAREVAHPPGFFSYFDHSKERKGYSGVAIYTKPEPTNVVYDMGSPTLDREGRLVAAFYDNFVLLNVYFPNGGGGPHRLKFKLDFYDHFLKYIEKLRKEGHKIIVCGDVNTAHTEIDLARPKENVNNTGFLPIERAWLDKVFSAGYVDVFRHFYPEKTSAYTYWDMKTFARDRNVGWRIDYFIVSPDLLPRVKGIEILDGVMGSDHCPIMMEIESS